jgi:hypothetical protein
MRIIVDGGGINWCWYSEYEIGETEAGLAPVKLIWSDRFHRFDERQGAGKHPTATYTHCGSAARPILRQYAREMTEEEKASEQRAFDFFWRGWEGWCKRYSLDPNGEVSLIQVVSARASDETLVLVS